MVVLLAVGRWQETSPEIKSKIRLRWEDDRAKIKSEQERRRFKQRVNGAYGEGKEKWMEQRWGENFSKIGFW